MTPRLVIRPYILDPRLPATSFEPPSSHYDDIASTNWTAGKPPSKKEYFEKKFTVDLEEREYQGGSDWTWRSENAKVGATWDAHRLVWLAGEVAQEGASSGASGLLVDAAQSDDDKYPASMQEVTMEHLYKAFHTTDDAQMDLSNRDYTSRLAHELGLFASVQEAKKWLESDAGDSELAQALVVAQMNGVQSVPFFVIQDGSDHLNGSGSYEEFMKMFDMAAALHR
ncbi:Thioredoxin-like fold [Ceraceosorus bombacis]|uniref:Thioredoxin-like fold n=1 Tax=Ceraceosorus bombacis TaxID=401625 RepID=A0A0P1BLM5_9BASI|nr:Thioredoxin-like fold [Ceraceosorus bombacis]